MGGGGNGPFGQGGFGQGGFGFGGGGFGGFQQGAEVDMNDVMDMFAQAMGGGSRVSTIQVQIQLGFFEAVNGCKKDVTFEYFVRDGKQKKIRRSKSVSLDIPAGIDDGMTMRAPGKGVEAPKGGPDGDLLVHVSVRPDPYFVRRENDIHVEVPISLAQVSACDNLLASFIWHRAILLFFLF